MAELPDQARIPRATYRLQFHREFDFDAAIRVLPYLARLGISHVYCSPIARARPGSTHGYDVVAHGEINPELGGAAGHARFSAALRALGMGQILDMVPNHMAVLGADNPWWTDVLENGAGSAFAAYFDIDWTPIDPELAGKVLLPALGDHYGSVLASGQLRLAFEGDAGALVVRFHEHRFPLDPATFPAVLRIASSAAADEDSRHDLADLADAFGRLPARDADDPDALAQRRREAPLLKAELAAAARRDAVADAIARALDSLNADGPRDALHALLERQAYRLAYWRVAADEINYRRFFDINELAALRIEHEPVFEATHGLALDLAASGSVDGLRIDHPDGLHDPAQYFERLQQGYAKRRGGVLQAHDASGRPHRPLYVVAEKIAAPHESVPESWHVHGTTGYRFAAVANGVLVDSTARLRFERIWRRFSGVTATFEVLAHDGKRAVMRDALASELVTLATWLLRIARADRRTRDHTFNSLRNALAEVAACLPVYRTYIVDTPSTQDVRYIDWAIAHARRRHPTADASVFDVVRWCLLGETLAGAPDGMAAATRRFAMRFQQFSAPVAAKGVEDTAFYRDLRLASLNEVGGDPATFGITVRAFHGASADRAARWPHTILATSTHDNKRSEDVRTRIDVLSEVPGAWRLALGRWQRMNRGHRRAPDAPSAADEFLLYQTLLGTWPAEGLDDATLPPYRERIERYMLKAAREAKLHTHWVSPDADYEAALSGFIGALLARVRPNPFLADLHEQARPLAWFGALNSLSLVLLKFTSPGVPDLYQGNELMDLSLVDPDNRRAVDFALRERALAELDAWRHAVDRVDAVAALLAAPHDGRAKLWFTTCLLDWRRRLPALFERGDYTALAVQGARSAHVIAYQRRAGDDSLLVVAGRLFARLGAPIGALPVGAGVWSETRVAVPDRPAGQRLLNVLSGEIVTVADGGIRLAEAFARIPAAAFVVADGPSQATS